MQNISIKVLVIGDSGVGKSCLLRKFSDVGLNYSGLHSYNPTIGCTIEILSFVHEKYGNYTVEMWEVGGNPRFRSARSLFYDDIDGAIFVWDVAAETTCHSLQIWLNEINQKVNGSTASFANRSEAENAIHSSIESSSSGHQKIPFLVVGNKVDKLDLYDVAELKRIRSHDIYLSAIAKSLDVYPFRTFFERLIAEKVAISRIAPLSSSPVVAISSAFYSGSKSAGRTVALNGLRYRVTEGDGGGGGAGADSFWGGGGGGSKNIMDSDFTPSHTTNIV